MLPDFPNIKAKLVKLLLSKTRMAQSLNLGPLADIKKTKQFEGNKAFLIREDGSIDEIEFKEFGANLPITDLKSVESQTPEDIIKMFNNAGKDIAKQQSKLTYEKINKGVKEVGNVIDAGGKPFCLDDFFRAIEKIQIDFDNFGNPYMPTFVGGQKAIESVYKVLPQLEDPLYKKRYNELMEKKKEEWRDRESNRKLVG